MKNACVTCFHCNYKWNWKSRESCFKCKGELHLPKCPWRMPRGAWGSGDGANASGGGGGKGRWGSWDEAREAPAAETPTLASMLAALADHVPPEQQDALKDFKQKVQPPPKERNDTSHAKYQRLVAVERRAVQALDNAALSEHKAKG